MEIKQHSPPDSDKHRFGRYFSTLKMASQLCIPVLQCLDHILKGLHDRVAIVKVYQFIYVISNSISVYLYPSISTFVPLSVVTLYLRLGYPIEPSLHQALLIG